VLATICPDPPDLEPLVRALWQSLLVAAALLAAQITFHKTSERISFSISKFISSLARRRFLCGVFLFFAVVAVRIALLPRLPVPVPGIHDEFSYLLMGDTFAHRRLSNPPHPMWMSFETFHVNWFPRYASMYPPGQGFVLAIGQLLGHPWIGVLLGCAAMCVVVYWMLLAWLPPRWALLGAIVAWLKFGVTSYWMNSYWGGAVSAIGGALLLGALARLLRRATLLNATLFALGLAILANSRPYEGLIFSLPALFILTHWLFQKPAASQTEENRRRATVLPIAAVLLLTGAFMATYNWRLTGHALLFPNALNVRTYHTAPMFLFQPLKPEKHYNNQQFEDFYNGWEREEYDHSWESVKCLTWLKTVRFFSAFSWWGMSLAFPGLLFVTCDQRIRLACITLAFVAVTTYVVVWSNAHYAAPVICIVILAYLQALRRLRLMKWRSRCWGAILARTSVLLLLVDTTTAVVRKQCDTFFWTCQGDISRLTIQRKLAALPGKHLVMVRYGDDHNVHDDWVFNGAEIDSAKVIWAREISAKQDAKLFDYFHDRKIWLAMPDTDNTYLGPYRPPAESDETDK